MDHGLTMAFEVSEGGMMPTQLQAWARAWSRVSDDVRAGTLTSRGLPSRKVRNTLFNALFDELPTELRSPRYQSHMISEHEADLIVAAVTAKASDLSQVSAIAERVKEWVANTPEVAHERAKNPADVWAARVQKMIQDAGGITQLAALGPEGWDAWLRRYSHVDAERLDELPADGRAIARYLCDETVRGETEQEIARTWAARLVVTASQPDAPRFAAHLPWREPDAEQRRNLGWIADRILAGKPHDPLCRTLGLTDVEDGPLTPPQVVRSQEAARAKSDPDRSRVGMEAPLDRSLLSRLTMENDGAPTRDGRTLTVRELVAEEIARAAATLGLLGLDARRAFVVACAQMAMPLVDILETGSPAPGSDEDALLHMGAVVRGALGKRRFDHLPPATQRILAEPSRTFGPRLWSRLHNHERDLREVDPFSDVRSAWVGWLQDVVQSSHRFLEGPLEDTPGMVEGDGAPSNPRTVAPRAPHVGGEQVVVALRHLAETVPVEVKDFLSELRRSGEGSEDWAGEPVMAWRHASADKWQALIAVAQSAAPDVGFGWPHFDDLRFYLSELGWELP